MVEEKKVICRTLGNVVRRSPLADSIDPKAFFMMLNTNFPVLYQDGTFNLAPVWDALSQQHDDRKLAGLFVLFSHAADDKGFAVSLPPLVAAMTPEQRQQAVLDLETGGEEPPDVFGDVGTDEFFVTDPNADPAPLKLDTGDLKPVVPDETRQKITQAVVSALRQAPVGQMLDPSQLAYLVDSNFDDLCDGSTFNFDPILGGLRQLEGFEDTKVYVGVVKLDEALQQLGVHLQPVDLDVPADVGQRLLEEHRQRVEEARRAEAQARQEARRPPQEAPPEEPKDKKPSNKERRLEELGLSSGDPKKRKAIRYAVLSVLLVVVAVGAWLNRPDRPVDVGIFGPSIPMKSAELRDGVFYGTVDGDAWWKLPVPERKQRYEAFEDKLQDEGLARNSQVRDEQGRLVITYAGGGKLRVAKFFVEGHRDGSVPQTGGDDVPDEAEPEDEAEGEEPGPADNEG